MTRYIMHCKPSELYREEYVLYEDDEHRRDALWIAGIIAAEHDTTIIVTPIDEEGRCD